MHLLLQKLTPVSVVFPLAILAGAPYGVYLLFKDSVSAIGGVYVLIGVAIAALLVAIDRALAFIAPLLPLQLVETLLLVGGVFYYNYGNRQITLDISKNPSPNFVILYAKNPALAEPMQIRFPFDKQIVVSDRNYVILSDDLRPKENGVAIELKTPLGWNNGFSSVGEIASPDSVFTQYQFYFGDGLPIDKARVDSLRAETLAKLPKVAG